MSGRPADALDRILRAAFAQVSYFARPQRIVLRYVLHFATVGALPRRVRRAGQKAKPVVRAAANEWPPARVNQQSVSSTTVLMDNVTGNDRDT
jgi:hypothetical protein